MKLLIDMNLSPRCTDLLTEAGFDASHWSTIGPANADDCTIMAFARDHGSIVLTHDLNFGSILATTQAAAPSVVQLRADDIRPEKADEAVIQALRQCAVELEAGALLTVDPARFRVTLLPPRH